MFASKLPVVFSIVSWSHTWWLKKAQKVGKVSPYSTLLDKMERRSRVRILKNFVLWRRKQNQLRMKMTRISYQPQWMKKVCQYFTWVFFFYTSTELFLGLSPEQFLDDKIGEKKFGEQVLILRNQWNCCKTNLCKLGCFIVLKNLLRLVLGWVNNWRFVV